MPAAKSPVFRRREARAVPGQIVALGVPGPVGSDGNQAVIEQAIQRRDVAGELSGMKRPLGDEQIWLG